MENESNAKKKKLWWIILAVIGLLSIICGSCLFTVYLWGSSPEEKKTDTDSEISEIIEFTPTTTAETSEINEFTPTTTAGTSEPLTVRDIELKVNELTDVQWERYILDHLGKKITFKGDVLDVYEDYISLLEFTKDEISTAVRLYGIPYYTLITLKKYDYIQGEGVIKDIRERFFGGITIEINVTSY